ncbi:MAG: antitoxin FitA [Thermoanaerobaculia bacterium]|jgi:plasmid stability protein|nr:antitoxin FitA [Thermoanaerobaculia bacterium]
MGELLVDEIEQDVLEKLQERARCHGRSTEEEVREILRTAVITETAAPFGLGTQLEEIFRDANKSDGESRPGLGTRLAARFRDIGLKEEIPELRGYPAQPADFDDP